MHEPLTFPRWIKQLRVALDFTQERLAAAVGCAVYTIRTVEHGTRRPSRALAERLAETLQVAPEQRVAFLHLARAPLTRSSAATAREEAGSPMASAPPLQPADAPGASTRAGLLEQTPILATKLYLPRPRRQIVPRPRLLARLDASRAAVMTLICAPAGFGKTTLLSSWIHQALAGRYAVAWLSLDTGDRDPLQFLRYLVAALQTVAPAVGRSTLAVLHAAQAPPLELVLPLLVNDLILLPEKSILVLDDYHVIDTPAVHQALTFLLDHLPPQCQLVLASRADPPLPLSRLRARGELTEVRAQDLRFTPEEAATFLTEVMGVPLAAEEVTALEARTEGWIAGLQLAALSLQDRPDAQRAAFIDAFTGSHRFVMDYLLDEVLARQSPHLQTFVLHTAFLDRLCGPLCDAVVLGDGAATQHAANMTPQAYSQRLLEELERSNLFIIPLDDERRWYRYHQLFAQVVRERLTGGTDPDVVAALHRRASAWFAGHGLVVEAVQHALAAQDWEGAARLIEEQGLALLGRGQVHTMLGWLTTLPDSLAGTRPLLDVIHASMLFCVNQMAAAELRAQAVVGHLSADTGDEQSRTILGTATMTLTAIAHFRGDHVRGGTLARQALAILPPTVVLSRNAARLYSATTFLVSGDVAPAKEHALVAAVASLRTPAELGTLVTGLVILARLQRRQGRLRQAAATYREAAQVAPEPLGLQVLVNGAAYYFGLGDLLREWNDLDGAEALLLHGRELVRGRLAAEADATTAGYSALARLQQARGERRAALATLHEFDELAQERSFVDRVTTEGAATRAQLALMQEDLQTAVQWADGSGLGPDDDLSYPREVEYMTLARVRVAQGRSRPTGRYLPDALHLLDRLLASAEAGRRMDSVIEILILHALTHQAQADLPAALAALARALTLAAPEGYMRMFVDEGAPMSALLATGLEARAWGRRTGTHDPDLWSYVQQLLTVFHTEGIDPPADLRLPSAAPPALTPTGEVLTEREREVLRLLAQGSSNQAIAQELIVAVGTVKRHVSNIMGKLDAHSRLEAVARARALNLV